MALTFTFQPDIEAVYSKANYGVPFVFRIVDENGNPVDLTNTTNIEIEFRHKTDISVPVITRQCVKSDALNGICYYVSQPNIFNTTGSYVANCIVYFASSTDFPDGRKIKSYRVLPDTIEVVE